LVFLKFSLNIRKGMTNRAFATSALSIYIQEILCDYQLSKEIPVGSHQQYIQTIVRQQDKQFGSFNFPIKTEINIVLNTLIL
jgi:hypothetical protein